MKTRMIFVVFMFLPLMSCDDFLTKEPRLSQTPELTLSTFEGLNQAVVGSYSLLCDKWWYGCDLELIADLKAGNAKKSPLNSGRFWQEYFWTNEPGNTANFWFRGYIMIARLNNILNALDGFSDTDVTQAQIDNLKGECTFLRALTYHDLVRLYAQPYAYAVKEGNEAYSMGVPLVLGTTDGAPARSSVGEVYEQIVLDLKEAEEKLAAGNTHGGYDPKAWATPLAVSALLARVYLYMEDWQRAADYATLVLSQESATFRLFTPEEYAVYDSVTCPEGVWGAETGGAEVIFEVYGSETNTNAALNESVSSMLSPGGYGEVEASDDLLKLFTDVGDVRSGLFVNTKTYPKDFWSTKFPGKSGNLYEDNIPVLRLSEMYLIRAEALLNGAVIDGVTAVGDMNTLRAARGIASVLTSDQVTKNFVYTERRRELCFEGHELFDLARTQRGLVRTDYSGSVNRNVGFPDDKWAMPIPQREIDANSNCVQNPGYGNTN